MYLEVVNDAIYKYAKKSQIIDDAFAPFSPCASDYFRNLFNSFAHVNKDELVELSSGMTSSLLQGEFDVFIEKLDSYIDNNILSSDWFNRPIMDTMHDLVSTNGWGDISTALGDWVFNHRHWNVRLKTGYSSLHTEINIYMPVQGAADVKRRYEDRGLGRMNLFADTHANRVAVLYHAGAFDLEDLYYESLYVDVGD